MHEVERKYEAVSGEVPSFDGLGTLGNTEVFTLGATYYDTLGHELTDSGWVLRRRRGGHDAGWHLKRPVSSEERTEEWAPDAERVPGILRTQVSEEFGNVALLPVADLSTHRKEQSLLSGGRVVALLASDEVTATVGGVEQRWTEFEVELAPDADLGILNDLEPALAAAGFRRTGHRSKIARALAGTVVPKKADSPDAPASAVLLTAFAKHIGVLQAFESAVRVDAPDAVHKSRVATRKLRSLLRTFETLLDAERAEQVREELKWWGQVLGFPRDAEVLRDEFGALLAELGSESQVGPISHRLMEALVTRHEEAHRALVKEMSTARYESLTDSLQWLLQVPPFLGAAEAPARQALPPLVEIAVGRVLRRREKAERKADELELWHEVRKAAKAVRYSLEALKSSFGTPVRIDLENWTNVTEAFGTLQDAVVARALVKEIAAKALVAGEPVHTYQVLADAQLDRRDTALIEGRTALMDAIPLRGLQTLTAG